MRRFNKNTLFAILGALLALIIVVLLLAWHSGHSNRTIIVRTDTPPLKLELNDSVYSIGSGEKTIVVPPDIYSYRAGALVDGQRIVLTAKLDLLQNKTERLELNYLLYNRQSIASVLCATPRAENKCLFTPQSLRVEYLEGYQWAAVFFDTTTGKGKAVLRIESGKWKIISGPGSDIPITGYYPQSVEEALQNE